MVPLQQSEFAYAQSSIEQEHESRIERLTPAHCCRRKQSLLFAHRSLRNIVKLAFARPGLTDAGSVAHVGAAQSLAMCRTSALTSYRQPTHS